MNLTVRSLVEDLRGLRIGQPRKRRRDLFQPRDIGAEGLQFGAIVLEDPLDDGTDEIFRQFQQAGQIDIGDLRLDHPELGQVAAGLAFFGAEGGAEAIDLAVAHGRGFEVELAGLRQVHRLAEVIDGKERLLALAGDGGEDRRIDQGKAVVVEEAADGVDDRMADPADAPRPLRPQVQMAVVHQEFDAVLLGRDGVILRRADDLGGGYGQFMAAGRAGLGPDEAGDRQRRFLAQARDGVEEVVGDLALFDDALAQAGAVANHQKHHLAAGPVVIDPAGKGHFRADMILQSRYRCFHGC